MEHKIMVFAAGREVSQALDLLSDGAFKLFIYLCLNAGRRSGHLRLDCNHLARAWHKSLGLPVIVSHCSNNYGPRQTPDKLIPKVITNAIRGKAIPIYGDGSQVRDWIWVEVAKSICDAPLGQSVPPLIGLSGSPSTWTTELIVFSPPEPCT